MYAVLDTNVLVSSLWSPDSGPAKIVALMQNGVLVPCYDSRILTEYQDVLRRPKFQFSKWEVDALLDQIEKDGLSVVPLPLTQPFTDEDDRKFFEVAKHCNAQLITGNLRHFPQDDLVVSVADFLYSV
jgi:putative PIN family toxin of toxin-antitoxin system